MHYLTATSSSNLVIKTEVNRCPDRRPAFFSRASDPDGAIEDRLVEVIDEVVGPYRTPPNGATINGREGAVSHG